MGAMAVVCLRLQQLQYFAMVYYWHQGIWDQSTMPIQVDDRQAGTKHSERRHNQNRSYLGLIMWVELYDLH